MYTDMDGASEAPKVASCNLTTGLIYARFAGYQARCPTGRLCIDELYSTLLCPAQ